MVETDKDINAFFNRVLSVIKDVYNPATTPAFPSENQFKKYSYLLSMRRFPKAVQRWVFNGTIDWGDGCWIESLGQEDWPYSQIHVRFQAHLKRSGGDMMKTGWIGLEYGRKKTGELLTPKCFLAFDGKSPLEVDSPKDDWASWASGIRQKMIDKLKE